MSNSSWMSLLPNISKHSAPLKFSAFGVHSKRAPTIMATSLCDVLALLLDFRYQLALYFCYNLVALLILWLFYAHMDPLPPQEESNTQRKPGNGPAHAQNEATSCNTPQARRSVQDSVSSGDQTPTVSQVRLRNIQPKVSFLDLRLTDTRCINLTDKLLACSSMQRIAIALCKIPSGLHQPSHPQIKLQLAIHTLKLERAINCLCLTVIFPPIELNATWKNPHFKIK